MILNIPVGRNRNGPPICIPTEISGIFGIMESTLCYTVKSFVQLVSQCFGDKLHETISQCNSALNPQGNNNLNFRLALDQVILFETAANLWASRRQANHFFAVFFHVRLNDLPRGKDWVLFPLYFNFLSVLPRGTSRVSGNKTHCFPWGQSLSAFW